MTDQEIYDLSSLILPSIAADLSAGIYATLGGSLIFNFSTLNGVRAWAESLGDPSVPPQHRIVITYELARRLYRDAEEYHQFAANEFREDRFQIIFRDYDPKPSLAAHIEQFDSVRNMFIGSLTWVFFHELGHLIQEHGYIRSKFGFAAPNMQIEDCDANAERPLEGKASSVSHTTEFAADIEATQWCVMELIRHFLPKIKSNDKHSLLEFRSNLYLMVCGISMAFYRFNGERHTEPQPLPHSSHPTPIRRLEVCLPNVFEKLDLGSHGQSLHELSRPQLVYLCTGAAYSVGFFWLWRYARKPGIPDNFMPQGLLQDPFGKSYWNSIVETWDEIEPTIRRIRRFGSELGIMSFTDTFRSQVLK